MYTEPSLVERQLSLLRAEFAALIQGNREDLKEQLRVFDTAMKNAQIKAMMERVEK